MYSDKEIKQAKKRISGLSTRQQMFVEFYLTQESLQPHFYIDDNREQRREQMEYHYGTAKALMRKSWLVPVNAHDWPNWKPEIEYATTFTWNPELRSFFKVLLYVFEQQRVEKDYRDARIEAQRTCEDAKHDIEAIYKREAYLPELQAYVNSEHKALVEKVNSFGENNWNHRLGLSIETFNVYRYSDGEFRYSNDWLDDDVVELIEEHVDKSMKFYVPSMDSAWVRIDSHNMGIGTSGIIMEPEEIPYFVMQLELAKDLVVLAKEFVRDQLESYINKKANSI